MTRAQATAKYILPKTQRNDVLQIIHAAKLSAPDFEWQEKTLAPIPLVADEGLVSVLVHMPTGYFFLFDARNRHMVEFSPGVETPSDGGSPGAWAGVLQYVGRWAARLKQEVDAPDLWAEIGKERALLDAASGAGGNNTPFTEDERPAVVAKLAELQRFIETTTSANAGFQKFVKERFEYLEGAVGRLGRSDWLHTLIGVLATIAFSGMLTGDSVRELFRFVGDAFAGFFRRLLS